MMIDTAEFAAITAENDELRSELGELGSLVEQIGEAVLALSRRMAPARQLPLTAVAATGRGQLRGGRHAAPKLRVIDGGQR